MKLREKLLIIGSITCILGTVGIYAWNEKPAKLKDSQYRIEKHDVDQVFRDHDGYRILFDNPDGKVTEIKYFSDGEPSDFEFKDIPLPKVEGQLFKGLKENDEHIKIYKDLDAKTQGFANVAHYKVYLPQFAALARGLEDCYYVEIHLPKSQSISPGNETWREGKTDRHESLKEIE